MDSCLVLQQVPGTLEVRGEVFIALADFEALNRQQEATGQPLLANARNAASGSLRLLDPAASAQRRLSFVAYQVSTTALYHARHVTNLFTRNDFLSQCLQSKGIALLELRRKQTAEPTTRAYLLLLSCQVLQPAGEAGGSATATSAANTSSGAHAAHLPTKQSEKLKWLERQGFVVPSGSDGPFDTFEAALQYAEELRAQRSGLAFEADGVVFKVGKLLLSILCDTRKLARARSVLKNYMLQSILTK